MDSDAVEGVGVHAEPGAGATSHASVQIFLIADIRGYTRFTVQRGDEAATYLAARFAAVTHDVVNVHDGRLLELRGDEALVVFTSPRAALRAAAALQAAYVAATLESPGFPLGVGIGLDVGEAVPLQRGYRGAALNLAARLCAQAVPGEILASAEVAHLAGPVDRLRYEQHARVRAKGFAQPVAVVRVRGDESDASTRSAFERLVRPQAPSLSRSGVALLAAITLVLATAVAVLATHGSAALVRAGSNTVAVIAPGGPRLLRSIAVGTEPDQIASGAGAVWAVNTQNGSVDRIDPRLFAVVQAIPVGDEPQAVAVASDTVWVANTGDATVSRIDATTDQVVQAPISVGNGPSAIVVTSSAVWVANRFDGTVTKLDARTGAPLDTIRVGEEPAALAADAHGVWVANFADDTVSRIDPRTDQVAAPIGVGGGPVALAIAHGGVWVANETDGTVSRIDPNTEAVTGLVQTGRDPTAIAAAGSTVWVANEQAGALTAIRADSVRLIQTIPVGQAPRGLAVVGGRLWVTVRAEPAVAHRGGTLRVWGAGLDTSIDPTRAYFNDSWSLLADIYDGLVSLRHVGGIAGLRLVPDLAVALPKPTDSGRTYTFHLRSGLRYSSGQPVRASDIRRGLERALFVGSLPAGGPFSYFEDIVGAGRCVQPTHRPNCDLSAGVVADDTAGTVAIHLTAADPEFLYKLSFVAASAAAPGAPFSDVGTHALPATGPYMIQSYRRGPNHPGPPGELVVVRNPKFRVWSADAQPDGYPDRMVFTIPGTQDTGETAVEHGRTDLTPDLSAGSFTDAQHRYPGQSHAILSTATTLMFLDVTKPPFNNPLARQAVNLALDRRQVLEAFGGPAAGEIHCQVLPAGFPGYRPYCPYTLNPGPSGTWTAPDVLRALQLVSASGTRGATLDVWTLPASDAPRGHTASLVFVRALETLGYRVRLHAKPATSYFAYLGNPRHHANASFFVWGPDFPTPFAFFGSLLTCRALALGQDFAHYCSATLDRTVARDLNLEASDLAAADTGWSVLDHQVTDDAPIVPLTVLKNWWLTSSRVGNFTSNPQVGVLFDQLWVQ